MRKEDMRLAWIVVTAIGFAISWRTADAAATERRASQTLPVTGITLTRIVVSDGRLIVSGFTAVSEQSEILLDGRIIIVTDSSGKFNESMPYDITTEPFEYATPRCFTKLSLNGLTDYVGIPECWSCASGELAGRWRFRFSYADHGVGTDATCVVRIDTTGSVVEQSCPLVSGFGIRNAPTTPVINVKAVLNQKCEISGEFTTTYTHDGLPRTFGRKITASLDSSKHRWLGVLTQGKLLQTEILAQRLP
jgi:hypothetical protein